jgi:hypothetical protein
MADVSYTTNRTLNGLAWGVPILTVLLTTLLTSLLTTPWNVLFLINFPILAFPPFVVLALLTFLELRQPEFVATAGALAAFSLACAAISYLADGWIWIPDYFYLPGFIAGTLLTLAWSRRNAVSGKAIAIAVAAPLLGATAEYALIALL